MKKIVFVLILALTLVASGSAYAASLGNFGAAIKGGVDFNGKWEVSGSPSFSTKTSASVAVEGYYLVNPYMDFGVGVQYMFQRDIKTSPGWKFWFLPVYAVARVHPAMTDFTPYAIFQVGYNFHGGNTPYFAGGNVKGGFYWGAGGGVIFLRHFLVEVLYSQSSGVVDPGDLDIKTRRITASIGYNF